VEILKTDLDRVFEKRNGEKSLSLAPEMGRWSTREKKLRKSEQTAQTTQKAVTEVCRKGSLKSYEREQPLTEPRKADNLLRRLGERGGKIYSHKRRGHRKRGTKSKNYSQILEKEARR